MACKGDGIIVQFQKLEMTFSDKEIEELLQ